MSIQQNPNQWGAQLPPSPTDALYWRERYCAESVKFRHWSKPTNPDLNESLRLYWTRLLTNDNTEVAPYWERNWTINNDNDSQSA